MDKPNQLNLPPLGLPQAALSLEYKNGLLKVFDPLRKKYVALTPEEYVRQTFVSWLINYHNYPASHLANEVFLRLNNTSKRCDTIAYGPDGRTFMIVEYKAPNVSLTPEVFNQVIRYNMVLNSIYFAMSNGFVHYCCRFDYDNNNIEFLTEIPSYPIS